MGQMRGTTVVCVRLNGKVALGGDGQVTLRDTVMKSKASKVRRLAEGRVLAGFAGGVFILRCLNADFQIVVPSIW